ncbi:tRNA(fMet)-specific endonuclease VapC [Candidatus Desulfarcum epimagneticum]|uniref:Ribonuclease VapC n=1 Tax=uncultured Desulfobacteraceae bacterium TaxID=218296 RepID=A0A484HGD4_9BACT|nr:tRNA(fMet)-specific endonuclease VapC [uncultured Desulfobacteraceae bacterium]
MLDTSICIYVIKKRPMAFLEKFNSFERNALCVSVVTYAEMRYGVERSSSRKMNSRILDNFISRLTVFPWDADAALEYGKLRVALEKKGTPIGNMDMLIAAHALSRDCVLVTHNVREFSRIQNLRHEDWA